MKLAEALSVVRSIPADAPDFPVWLACGFTPLHLQNFLAAHLQKSLPERKVSISTGLYDDLAGTVESWAHTATSITAAVAVEWFDLDPRLGFRSLGGWGPSISSSVLGRVKASLERLEAGLSNSPGGSNIAVSLPTLSLPPAFHTAGWHASQTELALEELVASFARRIGEFPVVSIVNRQHLDSISVPEKRYDFRSDLYSGFPYTMGHADNLGAALAALLRPHQPKKGLITDLDDTLWLGLAGEIGHENISWDLASHAQLHGLYQQMLQSLADQGVLVAIASKNSPEVVERALDRPDLALARHKLFPIEVHWGLKSESVKRILNTWNIAANSVVFIDDSPLELEEVKAAFPEIECIPFPKTDHAEGLAVLRRLRDLFGKAALAEEDSLRAQSIRQAHEFSAANGTVSGVEQFLASADATITLKFDPPADDKRVVELVNKTNQFNLNGIRFTEPEWQQALQPPGSFALLVSYSDRFGPLGKIGVLRGKHEGKRLNIQTWVMSCRAFSRRIEHQILARLFSHFSATEILFDLCETPKNGPLRDFLKSLLDHPSATTPLTLPDFEVRCPTLYHKVLETHG